MEAAAVEDRDVLLGVADDHEVDAFDQGVCGSVELEARPASHGHFAHGGLSIGGRGANVGGHGRALRANPASPTGRPTLR